jgi:hypothetical protein
MKAEKMSSAEDGHQQHGQVKHSTRVRELIGYDQRLTVRMIAD